MTIAFDAATESVRTGTTDPHTWTHTPVGTPKAVVVAVVHGPLSTDFVNAVTYGGVAMTEITEGADTATEPGRASLWFLGAGIPTGAQTVSVDLTSATTEDIQFVSMTFTAAADTEVIPGAVNSVDENASNPAVTLGYLGRSGMAVCAIHSGLAAPANLTLLSGMSAVHDHDFGNFVARVDRQTTAGTSDFTIGYTAGNDDVGLAAFAFAEALPAVTEWFISPSGNDTTGAGTEASPWRTLGKAHASLPASGDRTITCRGGTYANTTVLNWTSKAGISGNPIVVRAFTAETPVFDGNDTEAQSIIFDGASVGWIEFQDIEWAGFAPVDNGHMLFVNGAHDIRIIRGASRDLITATDTDHHFYAHADRISFEDVHISGGAGWGVHVFSGGGVEADSPKVLGCIFDGAAHGGVLFSDVSGTEGEIANNDFDASLDIGIKFPDWGATGVEVHHNQIDAAVGIHVESDTASPISEHDNTLTGATPFLFGFPGDPKTLAEWQAINASWGINDTVPSPTVDGTAAVSAAATLGAAGQAVRQGSASLAGAGTRTAAGSLRHGASSALSGTAATSSVGTRVVEASFTPTGLASVGATGGIRMPASAALGGAATLAATGSLTKPGAAAATGLATVAAGATLRHGGQASASAAGQIAAAANLSHAAVAALAGVGTLAASGGATAVHDGAAAIVGTSGFAVAGTAVRQGASGLAGAGIAAGAGNLRLAGAASPVGTATMAATGAILGESASATVAAAATLAASPELVIPASISLDALAAATAGASLRVGGQAGIVGTAVTSIDATAVRVGLAALEMGATVDVAGGLMLTGEAAFLGIAAIAVQGSTGDPWASGATATLSAFGTIGAVSVNGYRATVSRTGPRAEVRHGS